MNHNRQFTPFERLLKRLYELSLRSLPREIHSRWAPDMRLMFGERLREATDRGGFSATAATAGREMGSIALAAMQSRLGQATGRVHRAHDAQDGSDVWRTDPVPALLFERPDRRPLKLATVGALACHFALFLVVLPGTGNTGLIDDAPPDESWLVLQPLPPQPMPEFAPPGVIRRNAPPVPFAAPEPYDPDPVFDTRDFAYSAASDLPVSATFDVGLPVAPPTPPSTRLRAGADVELPRLIERVHPIYPELAVRAHLECTVVLEALIGKQGAVIDIKLLKACGLGIDDAALDAVYQWRYTPTLVNGRPVEVLANVTVRFELH